MTRSQRHLVDTAGYCSRDTLIAQGGWSPALIPPVLTSLTPNTAVVGDALLDVTVVGDNFSINSVVVGNVGLRTQFVSPQELIVTIDPTMVTDPQTVPIIVQSGWYYSDPLDFTFTSSAALSREELHHESVAKT